MTLTGLKPVTFGFEGQRSIQLSYSAEIKKMSHLGIEPSLPKEQIKSLLQSHSAINGPKCKNERDRTRTYLKPN